jgi:parvulin-like peptidyl-prolyl isomerase
MKRFVWGVLLIGGVVYGGEVLDKIVAVVGNIPITLYQIEKTAREHNIPLSKAFNYLVDKALIDYELRQKGVEVDQFQLDRKLEEIARQNGMSREQFVELLKERGEYERFISKLKEELKRDKLFSQIAAGRITITPAEIENYYKTHLNRWRVWELAQVTAYSAPTPQLLKPVLESPLNVSPMVKSEEKTLSSAELPLPVVMLISQTPVGGHTPIIPTKNGYVVYYVEKKEGTTTLPLSKVKGLIYSQLYRQKRQEILRSYFDKLKNSPIVQMVSNKVNVGG